MTSNLRRTLQAALMLVAVVWSVAAQAQDATEPPPAATTPATEPGSAASFAAAGDWLLSVENLFGYTYAHQSNNFHANTFTLFGDSEGANKSPYRYPGLGLDYMVKSSISLGVNLNFVRLSASNGFSNTGFEGALRLGYALMPGPSVGIWPRVGVAYSYGTAVKATAVTIELLLVVVATPHLLLTFGPVADIGVAGTLKVNSINTNVKFTDIGAYVGLTVPL